MPLRTWRKLKGAEVLGLTLTELLLLLTFALLLVMSIFFKELRATSALRDDLPKIARSADEISKKADEVSQAYFGEELDDATVITSPTHSSKEDDRRRPTPLAACRRAT